MHRFDEGLNDLDRPLSEYLAERAQQTKVMA